MEIKLHIFNVDHGDSILVEGTDNSNTYRGVIDCHNPNPYQDSPTLTYLKEHNVNHLNFICLTHPDYDHYSGLYQLIKYFSERERTFDYFYDFGMDDTKAQSFFYTRRDKITLVPLYELISQLNSANIIEYRQFSSGLVLTSKKDSKILSLGPRLSALNKYGRQLTKRLDNYRNNKSIKSNVDKNLLSVILAVYTSAGPAILLSDATKDIIEDTLQKWKKDNTSANHNFKIIKVSHHGSKHNHHKGLWRNHISKNHSIAIISSGNKYKLPSREVVNDIIQSGAELYCTTKGGALSDIRSNYSKIRHKNHPIDPLIEDGINQITSEIGIFPPLHGTITIEIIKKKAKVNTEYNHPPITRI